MTTYEYLFGLLLGAFLIVPALASVFGRDCYEDDRNHGKGGGK